MKTLSRKIAVAAAGFAVVACAPTTTRPEPATGPVPGSPSQPARPSETRSPAGGAFADGAYSATGYYGSVPSSIVVELTLAADVIRDVRVTSAHAANDISLGYQNRFAEAVPREVVGKRIDEVQVSRLAGSSGTPDGFNDALARIKEQAAR